MTQPAPEAPPTPAPRPSPASLTMLVVLAVVAALWASMLWAQLLVARAGGVPICLGGDQAACLAVWDAPLASAIHRTTGVPVAGWGVVWGLAAALLPLLALRRLAEGRGGGGLISAIRLTAAGGVAGALALLAAAALERGFCTGCLLSDLLVAGYAGIALPGWQGLGWPEPERGAGWTTAALAGAFALLLYPGLQTPRASGQAAREALERARQAAPRGEAGGERLVTQLVSSLPQPLQQALSDSLALYRRSPRGPTPAPRRLTGPAEAPVRITEFSDVLCTHCAELHAALVQIRRHLPPDSFSVDSRLFPLDAGCNPNIQAKGRAAVRCLAARAQICVGGGERGFAFSGALFESQQDLTPEKIFELAAPYMQKAELQACVDAPQTRAALEEDVALAARYDPEGTPLVLVNGRKGTGFGPFLYAMIVTGGDADHPAFQTLPPPNPQPHLH